NGHLGPGGRAIRIGRRIIPVSPGAVAGHVDSSDVQGGSIHLVGWAASLGTARPALEIDVFSHGHFVYSASPTADRPDVAAFYRKSAITRSGFDFLVPRTLVADGDVRVFGVVDGRATELSYHPGYAPTR